MRLKSCAAAVLVIALVAAAPLSEDDAVAISVAVQHRLRVDDLDASIFQEKPYAVAYWEGAGDGHGAGEALLIKSGTGWTIVKMTTGSLKNAALLESLGVPPATAQALVKDLETGKAP